MKKRSTEIPDIELPIIQAPIAGVQDAGLTIAVCEAGVWVLSQR